MEELGNSMPLAEGMVDSEAGNRIGLSDTCLNCGNPLTGAFCSQCGQKNIPKRQTLGELFENFLGSFFSYESKFFRTIKFLLFKPGFLIKEYNAGRRESYYHPARMYVFISFIYFLLFFSLPDKEENKNGVDGDGVAISDSTGNSLNFKLTSDDYKSKSEYDSVQATLSESERDGWFIRKMQYRALELNTKYKKSKKEFISDFGESFASNTPKVLFFLLPIFALLLKLLYIRRDFYYSEHLVMSIYFYNFFFAAGIVTMLLQLLPFLDWFSAVAVVAIGVYLLLVLKSVYQQGWRKTILKFLLLSFSFSICVAFGLLINLAVTLLIL